MILDDYWELVQHDFDEHLYLINGQAYNEVKTFLTTEHTFNEYKKYVVKYHKISLDISIETSTEIIIGIFKVHCGDAIMSLYEESEKLKSMVVNQMTQIYLEIGDK